MEKGRIDIVLGSKDRPTELGMLLVSLHNQTYQDFDIIILDDASGTPYINHHFLICIINMLKLNNHCVRVIRNEASWGISRMRIQMVKESLKYGRGEYICRIDDDSILDKDYLKKLIDVIDKGYDIATGIVPCAFQPELERELQFVTPYISDIEIDKDGNMLKFGDDCGFSYREEAIIPTPHFRSSCLYKKSIHDKGMMYIDYLTPSGFREEEFFSFNAIIQGFKIGCHTGAKAYHMLTPSGGDRRTDYNTLASTNHEMILEFIKKLSRKHGNFIEDYKKRLKEKGLLWEKV